MPVYDYKCTKCGLVQEKSHKMGEPLTEGCDNPQCDGLPEDLTKQLSSFPKHVSWSTWSVS